MSHRAAQLVACVGGVGCVPLAPGTAGSVLGGLCAWMLPLDAVWQGVTLACVAAAGIWASGVTASVERRPDPPTVVVDELVGMLIACAWLPKQPGLFLAAFVVFRILDIGKWFPINQLERLPGGWGIMADDVAAGLLARLAVFLVWRT